MGKKLSAGRMLLFAGFLALLLASVYFAGQTANPPAAVNYNYYALALAIPFAIVAIAYMASYAFNVPSLRAILQDELLQILATGAIALTLVGTQLAVDQYVVATLNASGATGNDIGSVMDAAADKVADLETATKGVLTNFQEVSSILGTEASKGVFCNFMGVGFSLNNCSPLNAYRGSLTAAAFTTTIAMSDTYAQDFILSFARNYAFSVIIPLGLLLRCFKVSRAAGGSLIAIGFGFYTVYPAVLLATDNLLHGTAGSPATPYMPLPGTCDPKQGSVSVALSEFKDYGSQLTNFQLERGVAYTVLVRVLFLSILNLIITLTFIRAFAHIIGSDIDVSSLARIS